MKAFLAAVVFSAAAAFLWSSVLSTQQREASNAFSAPTSVRL
jgi:hypothetical protein